LSNKFAICFQICKLKNVHSLFFCLLKDATHSIGCIFSNFVNCVYLICFAYVSKMMTMSLNFMMMSWMTWVWRKEIYRKKTKICCYGNM